MRRLSVPSTLLALAFLFALLAVPSSALAAPPETTGVPTITGEPRVGQLLKGTKPAFTGTATIQYSYRWERCAPDGLSPCTTVSSGATATQYTLLAGDEANVVYLTVTATNGEGSVAVRSLATPVIGPRQPPVNDRLPGISGTATDAQTLTADDGDWIGPGPITISRKWQRCDETGAACAPLAATTATYKLVSLDVGKTIRVQVSAKNSDGTTILMTGQTAVVAGVAPVNTTLPTTRGTTRDGQTVELANAGTWTGSTPMAATYQWLRCAADGTACAPIGDATQAKYVLTGADVGQTLRLRVTQTNGTGTASAETAPTAEIAPKAPPANTVLPAITGTLMDGQTLTARDGTWTGTATISYTRVWESCPDTTGVGCTPLASATAPTLALKSEHVGQRLRVVVRAKNPDDSVGVLAASDVSAPVAPAPPTTTSTPSVTGTPREGAVLTAAPGAWKGTPTVEFAYKWQRYVSGAWADIAGAAEQAYRAAPEDVGLPLRVIVTATNTGGTAEKASLATANVTVGPPVNTSLPTVGGLLPEDGQLYDGTDGDWAGTGAGTAAMTTTRQWQRCNASGASCTVISGAIDPSYRLTAADVGRTVRLEVAATNGQGRTLAYSAPSPVIGALRPTADATPTIEGDLRDGQTLTAQSSWTGTPVIALTYAWQRCDTLGTTCTDISGATAKTYKLTPADVASRMQVRIGASNAGGGGVATSDPTMNAVAAAPPAATAAPVLTGLAREDEKLTSTLGTWTGTPVIDRTVSWERCDTAGENCIPIGATGAEYVLTGADRGSTIRSLVTATNAGGTETARSAATAVVAASPPRSVIAPAVTPNSGLKDGVEVETTTGTWSGSGPIETLVRWHRCKPAGDGCAEIAGAAGTRYRLSTDDVGSTVRAVVTASGPGGSATQASAATGVVLTNPPASDPADPPTVEGTAPDGTAKDGDVLTSTTGTWSGLVPFTTTYEWWRCNQAGELCTRIDGATESSYRLRAQDVGLSVRVKVIQANAGGATGQLSAPTGTIQPSPPASVVKPQVVGGAAVGRTLTAEPGIWSGTPEISYAFRWERCQLDGTGCVPIPGALASTYTVTETDDAMTLRVIVTATNSVGAGEATSLTTAEIQDEPPVNLGAPSIEADGLFAQGAVVQGHPGAWAGAEPMTYAYRWRRCDTALAGCVDIPGATGLSYQLAAQDVGQRLLLVVTATNVVDVTTVQSGATPTVLPEPPSNTTLPAISATGGVRDGSKLSASVGAWRGATPMTYTVTWMRCDTDGANCVPVPDVAGTSYTLTVDDVGARMRARVAAVNAATEVAVQTSATTVVAAAPPVASGRAAVVAMDGRPKVGGRLRAVTGTFTGTAPMNVTYQWQRCVGSSLAACDDVAGATGSEYVLGEVDVSRRLRVVVTAANSAGSVRSESTTTETVPATPPENLTAPEVSGGGREGEELRATPGTWTGSAPMTFGYQWERCTSQTSTSCPKISGATRQTYRLAAEDVQKHIRVSVTAMNIGGRALRNSATTDEVAGIAPTLATAPTATLRGAVRLGGTLSSTPGTWRGTLPIKLAVRWQHCNAFGACLDIDGGSRATYTLKADDVTGTLLTAPMRVVVTATNVAGSAEAASAVLGTAPKPFGAGVATATNPGSAGRRRRGTSKVRATVKRMQLKSNGELHVTFSCPRSAKAPCGATGHVVGGEVRFTVDVDQIPRGKDKVVVLKLTAKQRKWLKGRGKLSFQARIAAPATPTRLKTKRVSAGVPKKLSGPVKKTKSKKKSTKKKSTKKKTSKKKTSKKKTSKKKKKKSTKKKTSSKKKTSKKKTSSRAKKSSKTSPGTTKPGSADAAGTGGGVPASGYPSGPPA